jgi:FlaA1/EpsC-like NDP-sugar epimerase
MTEDTTDRAGRRATRVQSWAREQVAVVAAGRLRRFRFASQAVLDVGIWILAFCIGALLRNNLSAHGVHWGAAAAFGALAGILHVLVGMIGGLYIGRWVIGSFEEMGALFGAALGATVATLIADLVAGRPDPLGAVVAAGFVGFVMTAGVRYGFRSAVEAQRRAPVTGGERLLVFGAGDAAHRVVRGLQTDPSSVFTPVAVLDDDLRKRHRRVDGVPVVGDRAALARAAADYKATTLLIAISSADAKLVSELEVAGREAGLAVKTIPSVGQLLATDASVGDIRDVTDEDLLGRRRVRTDVAAIAKYISGKRVLVTGAGGSIGSELSRQIYRYEPAELLMLDRDESALHAVQMSIHNRALLDSDELVLLDIRDRIGVEQLFRTRKPEVVFHAAALKHLPLLERHPSEAVKTNVWGTLALLEAASAHGVERFVNISTDKAAGPESVLGYSKRICERMTARFGAQSDNLYLSVRFGNVLGSRGSVLGAFRAQIEHGGPLTVTHPDVTRYFMTVEEAVQLVIQAGAVGRSGEALVLDMGEPVRIIDVARLLASRAAQPIEIVYTGLRPGEKLHEDLMSAEEVDSRPIHPLISHVAVPELDPALVQRLDPTADSADIRALLRELCLQGVGADRAR